MRRGWIDLGLRGPHRPKEGKLYGCKASSLVSGRAYWQCGIILLTCEKVKYIGGMLCIEAFPEFLSLDAFHFMNFNPSNLDASGRPNVIS